MSITQESIIKKKKNQNAKSNIITAIACFTGALNVLLHDQYILATAVVIFQLIILGYLYFVKKSITDYLGFYLIFLALSLEYEYMTVSGTLYGFKDFRIAGINLGIVMLLPIILKVVFKGLQINKIKKKFPKLFRFSVVIAYFSFTGVLFGLIQILINDNQIQQMERFLPNFIGVTYNMMALPILLGLSFLYLVSWEENSLNKMNLYLTSILLGSAFMFLFSLISGKSGTYGGNITLISSQVSILLPFLFILPFKENYLKPKVFYSLGICGAVLSLLYNASGKSILLFFIALYYLYKFVLRDGKKIFKLAAITLLPFVVIGGIYAIEIMKNRSKLFTWKLYQATSLLSFWQNNWLANLPSSPKVRVVQFINIALEYIQKPWFSLFGKGYMGTFKDHIGGFNEIQGQLGAFSMDQWNHGAFYRPHETLNVLFLYHGIFGLLIYIYSAFFILKNIKKNPWVLVGGVWFLLFYGYSLTISSFGIIALMLGLYEIDTRNQELR